MKQSLGLIEVEGWSVAMVLLDAAEKAAAVRVVQAEVNDFYGAILKLTGETAAVSAAVSAARKMAERLQRKVVTDIIRAPDERAEPAWLASREFNPLIEQDVVFDPRGEAKDTTMNSEAGFAIGLIETQGFTAVIEAIDTACKAANVEVLGREKLGGGYITVMIKGDVAAVQAAVSAGRQRVEGLGKLIAAHVIPRPSTAVMSLLPGG